MWPSASAIKAPIAAVKAEEGCTTVALDRLRFASEVCLELGMEWSQIGNIRGEPGTESESVCCHFPRTRQYIPTIPNPNPDRNPTAETMSAPADDPFAGYCPPDWPAGGPVPPVDPLVKECFHETSELYLEAARRLPIADIPYLARCLSQRGLAVGLCDPVTNILLTTLYGFALDKEDFPGLVLDASREEALQQTKDRLTFVDAIHRSRLGLIEFMTCYFRYLTYDEAKHCLTIAGHDLPLAVSLVQKSCGSLLGHPDPDSATTKAALAMAVKSAWCFVPQPFVDLMTSRYQRHMLAPVLDVLRYGKQLSADSVHRICNLLRHPCSPPPPPIPMLITPRTFRDSNGQVSTAIIIRHDLLPAPAIVSQDPGSMAIILSSARPSHGDTIHLSTALAKEELCDDDRFCSWEGRTSTWFLEMSLLETMRGLYITALARLPMYALHECHLIRAVLTAGHSYGPMHHPVANIMFNSIWYDALFPFLKDGYHEPGAADILDSRCMSRVESRSLDGIVALVCKLYNVSQREALEQLCKDRRELDLWGRNFMLVQDNIVDDVLLAAKHPQPAAYKAFIKGLTSAEINDMMGLMMMHQVISDDDVYQLKEMITKIAAARGIAAGVHRIAPALSQSTLDTLSARRSAFKIRQDYVRRKLEELLGDYSLYEGQGHQYHAGLICGVAIRTFRFYNYYYYTSCYHVNFLASMDSGVPNGAAPTPMHRLFFAEFWDKIDQRVEESTKPPICCVVEDYHKHFGRCNVCESSYSTIVHPPCCGYFMAIDGEVFPSAEILLEADLKAHPERMLDMDFIYFDAEKDHIESAKMTSGRALDHFWRQFPV